MEGEEAQYISPRPGVTETSPYRPRKRRRSNSSEVPPREYGLMRDTGRNDTSRFVGSASGIHFIRSVYLQLSMRSASKGESSQVINHLVPGEDDQIQPRLTSRRDASTRLWKEHEARLEPAADEPSPTFDQLVSWSKSYFESWHQMLPFLDGGEVLKIFEKVSASSIASLSHHEKSITRSILSISLADSRQSTGFGQPLPHSLVFHTVEEAILSCHFTLYEPASLHTTQAALSIQLFLISMLRLNAASRLGGLIVRMAFHLGLHRCPSRYPFFTKEHANIRRRVFWSLYCNERFLSQALGLPLDIQDDDVDVCFPGEETHSGQHEPEDSRLRLLKYLSKHARVRGLILELRNKSMFSRDSKPVSETKVRVEMARWSNEIQDSVEGENSDDEQHELGHGSEVRLSPGHRLYLLVLKFEAQISLNRPMMAGGPSNDLWSQGLQNCISAARCILTALRKHQARNTSLGQEDGVRLTIPVIWPTVTWAIWISSFILIYAASERQLPLDSALRHIEAGKKMLHHIATRQTSWPEYCLSAINTMATSLRDIQNATHKHGDELSDMRHRHHISNHDQRRSSHPNDHNPTARMSAAAQSHTPLPLGTSMMVPSTTSTSYGTPEVVGSDEHHEVEQPSAAQMRARVTPISDGAGPYHSLPFQQSSNPLNNQQSGGADAFPGPVAAPTMTSSAPSFSLQSQIALQNGQFTLREGEESLVWYEQLFSHSLGAIDFPYMAAAQYDSSIDPTWSYLR